MHVPTPSADSIAEELCGTVRSKETNDTARDPAKPFRVSGAAPSCDRLAFCQRSISSLAPILALNRELSNTPPPKPMGFNRRDSTSRYQR